MCTLFDPCFRHDLLVVPATMTKIEQAEASQVACRNLKMIGRVDRGRSAQLIHIVWLEILHPDWQGDALVEGFSDFEARLFLKNRPENVEVPIVVEPEGSRRVASPRGACLFLTITLEIYRMINPRAGAKKIDDSRLALVLCQWVG